MHSIEVEAGVGMVEWGAWSGTVTAAAYVGLSTGLES